MSKLNWQKFEGDHPAMLCNCCGRIFSSGGWCHDRPIKDSEPKLGTMSLVVCKLGCKWRIGGNPRAVEKYFDDLRPKALERALDVTLKDYQVEILKRAKDIIEGATGLKLAAVPELTAADEFHGMVPPDVVKEEVEYRAWRTVLINVISEELQLPGHKSVAINEEHARRCFRDGMTPYQAFRESNP